METVRQKTRVVLAAGFRIHFLMSHNEVSDPRKAGKSQGKRNENDDIY